MAPPESTRPSSGTLRNPGVGAALLAALLFGAGTPLAKTLLADAGPWMMAGLLYWGSGAGLLLVRAVRRWPTARLAAAEWPWLLGAIAAGGVVAPVLLMQGLARMPASATALLLNVEGVFTALLAWFCFKENFDRRIALGMLAIVAGAVVLSWPSDARFADITPTLLVLAACLAWALDNNLTRRVSLVDASWIASIKGISAGSVNLLIAMSLGAPVPPAGTTAAALLVGFLAYGVSLTLFVVALRHLGTARTGAYFSVAPFLGAAFAALLLAEPVTTRLVTAGVLMALGVWLHLTERHVHEHPHNAMEHEHAHEHDAHHRHDHDEPVLSGEKHTHSHPHEPMTHRHEHFPDAHHRHRH